VVHNGEKLKEENEYVKKGEVIISGDVYKDEEIVSSTDAKGEVYAEVWYKAKIIVPLTYKEKVKNKEINHYYLELFNKQITITGYYKKEGLDSETKLILDKPYLPFKLYKEKLIEYKEKEVTITEEEALQKTLKLSENEIKKNLDIEEYIISKNVLKNELKSSKMYIEVFFKVYENIGTTSIKEEKEKTDEERNS
jgi:similar to stage IV sporulation protein